ncbi:MBL fold metallo-hydrolase [Enterococcus nangangensis]|uniref:MBL fold metallo-hydrolase n=1 Tax=Enterococcus nangangensis TaxID=2559926 RepID=UPI0010F4D2F9|nr:MBL fold metallo-hydrolase [Enterococcus nangangensis]
MKITKIVTGSAAENCYLICGDQELLIVDPGADFANLQAAITALPQKPKAILLTHTHYDHIGALDEMRATYDIPAYVSALEAPWLQEPQLNLSGLTGRPFTCEVVENYLAPGPVTLGEFTFEVRATPGHSAGSLSFIFPEFAVVGDTLFHGSIGRTDFPTGDYQTLLTSIQEQLLTLPPDLPLYPGHGPETTGAFEKQTNPFLGGRL